MDAPRNEGESGEREEEEERGRERGGGREREDVREFLLHRLSLALLIVSCKKERIGGETSG